MSVTPVFDQYQRVIMYVGLSGDRKPTEHRVKDDCIFFETDTMRPFTFKRFNTTWNEKVHPDTQAALDKVKVLEAKELASTARLNGLEARLTALENVGGPP